MTYVRLVSAGFALCASITGFATSAENYARTRNFDLIHSKVNLDLDFQNKSIFPGFAAV